MFYPSCAIGAVGCTMQGQGEPIDVEKYLSLGSGDIVASDEFSVLEDEEDFTRDLPASICRCLYILHVCSIRRNFCVVGVVVWRLIVTGKQIGRAHV